MLTGMIKREVLKDVFGGPKLTYLTKAGKDTGQNVAMKQYIGYQSELFVCKKRKTTQFLWHFGHKINN